MIVRIILNPGAQKPGNRYLRTIHPNAKLLANVIFVRGLTDEDGRQLLEKCKTDQGLNTIIRDLQLEQ